MHRGLLNLAKARVHGQLPLLGLLLMDLKKEKPPSARAARGGWGVKLQSAKIGHQHLLAQAHQVLFDLALVAAGAVLFERLRAYA